MYFAGIRSSSRIRRAPEAQHVASGIADRPQQSALEEVPAVLPDQAGPDQHLGPEATLPKHFPELLAALGRPADREMFGGGPIESALVEELSPGQRVGAGQLFGEVLRGRGVRLQNLGTQPPRFGARTGPVGVPQLDADPVGQLLDGLGEGEIVDLLQEGDHVPPALAAPEAVVQPPRRGDLEAGGSSPSGTGTAPPSATRRRRSSGSGSRRRPHRCGPGRGPLRHLHP